MHMYKLIKKIILSVSDIIFNQERALLKPETLHSRRVTDSDNAK